mmetsp:Transcript_69502/g.193374  ORF Transcript_69502/g.193374 Transcript_69502/m.193374 type:complete len:206 (+) Transcript_69502:20-637(+)
MAMLHRREKAHSGWPPRAPAYRGVPKRFRKRSPTTAHRCARARINRLRRAAALGWRAQQCGGSCSTATPRHPTPFSRQPSSPASNVRIHRDHALRTWQSSPASGASTHRRCARRVLRVTWAMRNRGSKASSGARSHKDHRRRKISPGRGVRSQGPRAATGVLSRGCGDTEVCIPKRCRRLRSRGSRRHRNADRIIRRCGARRSIR